MNENLRYRGRFAQIWIYLGKFLRMFVYQSDWKVLPMSALIAGLVAYVVGRNIFRTQEGTMMGCFALACVCVWNGFFNSIQSVCRERAIIKREHRAGLHISSYIAAHMIYQMLLCMVQTGILLGVCVWRGIQFPREGLVFGSFMEDMAVSLFLATFAADMMALAISSLVHNTTTAMTMMPFMLIFQLVFSGAMMSLEGFASKLSVLTITRWGMDTFCALGNYNELPMVTLWNTIWKFRSMDMDGEKPVKLMTDYILRNDMREELLLESGKYNTKEAFAHTAANVTNCWMALIFISLLCIAVAVFTLEFIDNDKR